MSKMDALRAMREARYEQSRARAADPGAKPVTRSATKAPAPAKTAAKTTSKAAPKAASKVAKPDGETVEALCGHRNMSGRTCTREQGHAAKSHRYS